MDSFLQCYWYFHIAKLMLFAPFMQIYIYIKCNEQVIDLHPIKYFVDIDSAGQI